MYYPSILKHTNLNLTDAVPFLFEPTAKQEFVEANTIPESMPFRKIIVEMKGRPIHTGANAEKHIKIMGIVVTEISPNNNLYQPYGWITLPNGQQHVTSMTLMKESKNEMEVEARESTALTSKVSKERIRIYEYYNAVVGDLLERLSKHHIGHCPTKEK